MRFITATGLVGLATVASAAPAMVKQSSFKLPNGFPNPNATALKGIEKSAGGTLPNGALPTSLKADAITDFSVIAINEIFEVAYFDSLLHNVTMGVKGYTDFGPVSKKYVMKALRQIKAQEELHAIGANAILSSAGAKPINPCSYQFPVDNFMDAIALAATFTDLVLGTLQGVQAGLASDGGVEASAVVPLIASIIGQEGEQDGAYRLIGGKVPSASPFLTQGAGLFAYNAVAQLFIVPGSCGPEVAALGLPTLKTLTPLGKPGPKNGTVKFETSATNVSATGNYITYVSGQNAPVVVPISGVTTSGGVTSFSAEFPFASGFSKGLTVAGLTTSKGPFADGNAVAGASVAGPGLIEVQ